MEKLSVIVFMADSFGVFNQTEWNIIDGWITFNNI